jgi:hypothetical protein
MENNIIFLIILSFFFFILIVALIIIFVSQNNQSLQGCNSDKDCPSGSICKKNDSSIGVCEPKKDTDKKSENQSSTISENKNLPSVIVDDKKSENKNLSKETSQNVISKNKKSPSVISQNVVAENKKSPSVISQNVVAENKNPLKETSQNKNIVSRSDSAKTETSYIGLNINKLRKISSDLDSKSESKSESHLDIHDIHAIDDIHGIHGIEEYFCNKEDEYYLCAGIIDVCSFSNFTLFLLENGNIIKETNSHHEKTEIKNNIIFMRIFPFNGYLHAIDRNGYLYSLSNNYLNFTEWKWEKCIWFKDRIKYASTTLDNKYLLLQTYNKSFLFDKAHEQFIKEFDLKNVRRVYGKDPDHYIDINTNDQNCIIYPQEKILENIHDAALNYHNEVVVINSENYDGFLKITIVDWIPYFIRR